MSVMIIDMGNSIIKAKIARRDRSEISFPNYFTSDPVRHFPIYYNGGYGVSENKWDQIYNQLAEIVQGLETGVVEKESVIDNLPLSRNFVAAMKEGAREGVRN